ncbi:hypothetical protein SEE2_13325 [Salmonella enterica subsp. enterica serovar Enteritidis]|nr:hypothetical protein SEE2_13325 [Salmonella enterica subsp. enterica serovar Enteritidis]
MAIIRQSAASTSAPDLPLRGRKGESVAGVQSSLRSNGSRPDGCLPPVKLVIVLDYFLMLAFPLFTRNSL